jgi:large subunit ribosomal protein L7/L12
MSEKIDQIVEDLKTLTLLEASELVTKLKKHSELMLQQVLVEEWLMATAPAAAEEVEEKTEFDVVLDEVPKDKKIAILKIVTWFNRFRFKRS